jgi:hypothetical protein
MPDFFNLFSRNTEDDILKEQEAKEKNLQDLQLARLKNENWRIKLLRKKLEARLGSDFSSTYGVNPNNKGDLEQLSDMMGIRHDGI